MGLVTLEIVLERLPFTTALAGLFSFVYFTDFLMCTVTGCKAVAYFLLLANSEGAATRL